MQGMRNEKAPSLFSLPHFKQCALTPNATRSVVQKLQSRVRESGDGVRHSVGVHVGGGRKMAGRDQTNASNSEIISQCCGIGTRAQCWVRYSRARESTHASKTTYAPTPTLTLTPTRSEKERHARARARTSPDTITWAYTHRSTPTHTDRKANRGDTRTHAHRQRRDTHAHTPSLPF